METAARVSADVVEQAVAAIRARAPGFEPRVAVILGSGLAGASPELADAAGMPYAEIPGFPRPTVQGHAGRLVLGRFRSRLPVAVLQGRFHYYEGHPMSAIGLPVRALRRLGLQTLVVTSAVGSMRPGLKPGHVVALKDHVNLMGANPLRGCHTPEFGEMFPDLAGAYSPRLRKLALAECRRLKVSAREGVYLAISGPSYETPAEIAAFRRLGGDVVGMSVVPEVVTARQIGVETLALSWVANMAAGLSKAQLTHEEVLALGREMSSRLKALLEAILAKL